ncbi:MAG: tetratricopeptide repeat protein [Chloroflexi bacterium]|nr:tetratricopeptide repeat protein [Chloroflexota bacterium]
MLVTSRVWLNLPEEWGLPIEGCPSGRRNPGQRLDYESVLLFTACARRVYPEFSLSDELESVTAICRLVQGMPLCIELAAAWLGVLPAKEIAQQLDLKFLTSSSRGISERHRSAEAVFDASWRMLRTDEADALMRLSVFKGAFDREAAQKIAGATLPILASLMEKSLIRRGEGDAYTIHELLRQYAYDQLAARGDADAVHEAHLDHYVQLTSNPDSRIHGEKQTVWLDRLERDQDNLRSAISYALEHVRPEVHDLGLRLGASIWEFWLMRGHITEGRQWARPAAGDHAGNRQRRARAATQGAGYLAWIQGDSDRAEALHHEGLAIRQQIGDKAGMGGSLSNLGIIAWSRGDFAAARTYYERALAARREANYTLGVASVLTNLALLMQDQGSYDEAIDFAQQAWANFKVLDDLQGMVHVLYNMGSMHQDRGHMVQAIQTYEQSLELARRLGDQRVIGGLLLNLGVVRLRLGNTQQSMLDFHESQAIMTRLGDKRHLALVQRGMAELALHEGRLHDALPLAEESLSFLRQPKGDVDLGAALVIKGDILLALDPGRGAVKTLQEALDILVKVKKPTPIAEALLSLGEALRRQGQQQRALRLLDVAEEIVRRYGLLIPKRPPAVESAIAPGYRSGTDLEAVTLDTLLEAIQAAVYAERLTSVGQDRT